jgi:opacity protein-like surface antigen
MRKFIRQTALAVGLIAIASVARAESPSTSAINPTPVAPNGVIAGSYPAGETETSYYFAVDLKPGELATQTSFLGRPTRDKYLEFDLKDPKGKLLGYYSIMSGLDANQEATRVFPIDASGRYLIVLKTKGPETTSFQVALGGSAFVNREGAAPANERTSQSFLAPTPLPKDGVVAGSFPGGEKKITYYYFAADLKPGDLMTQISFAGRAYAPKLLELALLDAKGRPSINANYYIMSEIDAKSERTRTFPVDSAGRYILRVAVSGAEGTAFKVEFGGSAFQLMN